VSLDRILAGRPDLKYHEAGMDLGLHTDIKESYKIFQGRIHALYAAMAPKEGFTAIDSQGPIHAVQQKVRGIVQKAIDLPTYQNRSKLYGGT
jgi:dTMP kinase